MVSFVSSCISKTRTTSFLENNFHHSAVIPGDFDIPRDCTPVSLFLIPWRGLVPGSCPHLLHLRFLVHFRDLAITLLVADINISHLKCLTLWPPLCTFTSIPFVPRSTILQLSKEMDTLHVCLSFILLMPSRPSLSSVADMALILTTPSHSPLTKLLPIFVIV